MTRLPIESRLAIDRPDLPEYELNDYCPITGGVPEPGSHHLFRRSAGYPSWWVELEDGEVIGNRIRLSQQAHERVTVNKARISYESGVYYWIEDETKTPLRWQPPTMHQRKPLKENVEPDYAEDISYEQLASVLNPKAGETCTVCKRRVPHPKKASSPKTRVFSTRVPIDDVDTFSELVETAAEHHGLRSRPHFAYWTLLYGVTLLLQAQKGDLPS